MRRQRRFYVESVESLEDRVALAVVGLATVHHASVHHVVSQVPAHVRPALASSAQQVSSATDPTDIALTASGPSGGYGGGPFDGGDFNYLRSAFSLPYPTIAGNVQIAHVTVFSGDYIDSIQVTYAPSPGITGQPGKHGGDGGSRRDLLLQPGEYITEVSGRYGDYVDSLTIRTGGSRSQTMKWGGRGGSQSFDYWAPPGSQIVGFWGRSGDYIDAIGVLMTTPYSL